MQHAPCNAPSETTYDKVCGYVEHLSYQQCVYRCSRLLPGVCWSNHYCVVMTSLLLLHEHLLSILQGGMDLSPHLYVLPLDLTPFTEVLAALGAQEAFSASQYTTVLQVRRGLCGVSFWCAMHRMLCSSLRWLC